MKIPRDRYLDALIVRKWNGMAKVITGDDIPRSRDEHGIVFMNVIDFLLDPESMDY